MHPQPDSIFGPRANCGIALAAARLAPFTRDEDGLADRGHRIRPPPAESPVQTNADERDDGEPEARGRLECVGLQRSAPEPCRRAPLRSREPPIAAIDTTVSTIPTTLGRGFSWFQSASAASMPM